MRSRSSPTCGWSTSRPTYAGKCLLIAAALTLIERSLLPDDRRSSSQPASAAEEKPPLLIMLLMAITGVRPAAAAWSPNEEERRKALLSYLMEGVPAIIWDNIPRGTLISCPHIERSCTTEHLLRPPSRRERAHHRPPHPPSISSPAITSARKGDLASRAPTIRLEVDRADPENRPFMHPDPIAWTEANRGKILNALFTLLLGNPAVHRAQAENPLQDVGPARRLRRRTRRHPVRRLAGLQGRLPVARGGRRRKLVTRRCARRARRRMAEHSQLRRQRRRHHGERPTELRDRLQRFRARQILRDVLFPDDFAKLCRNPCSQSEIASVATSASPSCWAARHTFSS